MIKIILIWFKIVTIALFSEAEGIAILNALAKAGANVLNDEQCQLRDNKQHSTISRKTRVRMHENTSTPSMRKVDDREKKLKIKKSKK